MKVREPTPAPPPSTHAFALASLALANAIGEHHFTERELAILHVLRQLSFGSGRCGALIPKLKFFLPIGISEGNASAVLKKLKDKKVIEERPAGFYTFILPVAFWKADPKRGVARAIEQLELEVVQPHLRDLLRETFVLSFEASPLAGAARTLPTHTVPTYGIRSDRSGPGEDVHLVATSGVTSRESAGLGVHTGESRPGTESPDALISPQLETAVEKLSAAYSLRFPNREPRPKTDDPAPEGSRFGNPSQNPMPARLEREVPESGTHPAGLEPESVSASAVCRPDEIFEKLRQLIPLDRECDRRCWTGFSRNRPRVTAFLLGHLVKVSLRENIRSPGAFIMSKWKQMGRPNDDAFNSAAPEVFERGVRKTPENDDWAWAWHTEAVKAGADYTKEEVKSALLALKANGFMWGKNVLVDFRAGLERQIQHDRDRRKVSNYGNNPKRGFDRNAGTYNANNTSDLESKVL